MNKFTEEERLEYARTMLHYRPKDIIHPTAIIHPSVVIGKDGFGYARQENGTYLKMPHTGNVVIEAGVEIGACTCIDRAVTGSTVIGEGTKIDNLVHVGHGAKIGKHCLIVSHCNIGGSSEIGDDCYLGMSVTVINKVRVGKNVRIGAGALILKDVPDDWPDWIKGVWKGAPTECDHDFTGLDINGFTICKKCGEQYT